MFDFLFADEDTCYFCKENPAERFSLCESCLERLDFCKNNFKIGDISCTSLLFYNDFFARMISEYKYRQNTSLYKVFGEMALYLGEENGLFSSDFLLSSPSSAKTIKKRGFDHIRLICDYFNKQAKLDSLEGFKKVRETKSQHLLDESEREENLLGAFSYKGDLTGKTILIFDDIITSGNTIKEEGRVLKACGAKKIFAMSLAASKRIYESRE